MLKQSEKHLNPSFRRKPESSLFKNLDPGFRRGDETFLGDEAFFWTPAPGLQHAGAGFTGVTKRYSATR
jgi:hypothetical protein